MSQSIDIPSVEEKKNDYTSFISRTLGIPESLSDLDFKSFLDSFIKEPTTIQERELYELKAVYNNKDPLGKDLPDFDSLEEEFSNCVFAVFRKEDVTVDHESGGLILSEERNLRAYFTGKYERKNASKAEKRIPYLDQNITSSGTAFLYKGKLITSLHVVKNDRGEVNLSDFFFVHKWENTKENKIPKEKVYEGDEFVCVVHLDLISITLKDEDRLKTIKKPELEIGAVEKNSELFMIGHPLGLPLKCARGGKFVFIEKDNLHFKVHLNAFHGNSGSPILDRNTKKLVGVFHSGMRDHCNDPKKDQRLTEYPHDGFYTEKCLNAPQILNLL